jgi:hypothetical protein
MEEKTWQELGMKPGIRVPGTGSWMRKWRANPNQHEMVDYARKVDLLVKTMSEMKVNRALQLYLSGKWHPKDEEVIAAAIRRRPVWEGKFNLMEESLMSKKNEKKAVVKKTEAEGTSLKARIESLEKEVDALNIAVRQLSLAVEVPEPKKDKKGKGKKAEVATGDTDVKYLLTELEKAKKADDKKQSSKIRVQLRKVGYSLRAH